MQKSDFRLFSLVLTLVLCCSTTSDSPAETAELPWMKQSIETLKKELTATYGGEQQTRIERGLRQVASLWQENDGDAAVFEDFVRTNFAGDQRTLDAMFERFERLLEQLDGHLREIQMAFEEQTDLDIGPIYPFDRLFSIYAPRAHVNEDFFATKLAFVVLLNFPLTTLEERLTEGDQWTRRQWAEVRLAERFSKRIPAGVNQALSQATSEANQYIAEYNIWMHHVVDAKGKRLFPPGMKLLSHWNLRDELKAQYAAPKTGFAKQQMIQRVMERIVTQEIPQVVVNNPHVDWNPYTNEVTPAKVTDSDSPAPQHVEITNSPEPNARYEKLLKTFLAARKLDPYSPAAPTHIARRFDEDREIPEARVREMFEQVLTSPLVPRIAKLIESRLGRKLEPFDIWYSGFRPGATYTEEELTSIVSEKYPTPEAFGNDIHNTLMKLGFSRERAEYLASSIVVDPARGSGHASGAEMRSAKAHLRTRVGKNGMDYKGYNIAVHELGHNVEQVLSLKDIDHTLLEGVPNPAFTEAFAYVFQARDLELLGLTKRDKRNEALGRIDDFWGTFEIMGVALVDMNVWHWMYDHPDATPEELKAATIKISKDIWNTYYAPIFKKRDVILLGIYSHMIDYLLYLPDYPIGQLISFQIEEQIKKAGSVGAELERMAVIGDVTPDLWMMKATGAPVSADPLLRATEDALKELEIR